MAVSKGIMAFVLLLLIVLQFPRDGEARELILKKGDTKKFFATLGLVCKCCDGAKGECRSSWDSPCLNSKLQCRPWKLSN